MPSASEDSALLARLRSRDDKAFETLVRTYGGRLLAVARHLMRDEADAQDVVQSAYLNAFRGLDKFSGASQLSTWLHSIVVNTALMKIRSRRRKPEESIEALLPAFLADGHHVEQFSDWATPADALLERKETREAVRAGIDQLPENVPHRSDPARYRGTVHARSGRRPRPDDDHGQGPAAPGSPGTLGVVTEDVCAGRNVLMETGIQ